MKMQDLALKKAEGKKKCELIAECER